MHLTSKPGTQVSQIKSYLSNDHDYKNEIYWVLQLLILINFYDNVFKLI